MRKKVPRKNCRNCGKPCSRPEKVYCHNACQGEHRRRLKIENWLAGNDIGWTGAGQVKTFIREYMIELVQGRCEECGWGKRHPTTGRLILEVHHKDGNHENNTVENLGVLCPNCHALTPNYKNCNTGRGRACRRTRE